MCILSAQKFDFISFHLCDLYVHVSFVDVCQKRVYIVFYFGKKDLKKLEFYMCAHACLGNWPMCAHTCLGHWPMHAHACLGHWPMCAHTCLGNWPMCAHA